MNIIYFSCKPNYLKLNYKVDKKLLNPENADKYTSETQKVKLILADSHERNLRQHLENNKNIPNFQVECYFKQNAPSLLM